MDIGLSKTPDVTNDPIRARCTVQTGIELLPYCADRGNPPSFSTHFCNNCLDHETLSSLKPTSTLFAHTVFTVSIGLGHYSLHHQTNLRQEDYLWLSDSHINQLKHSNLSDHLPNKIQRLRRLIPRIQFMTSWVSRHLKERTNRKQTHSQRKLAHHIDSASSPLKYLLAAAYVFSAITHCMNEFGRPNY